jgi:hypothetical protein
MVVAPERLDQDALAAADSILPIGFTAGAVALTILAR